MKKSATCPRRVYCCLLLVLTIAFAPFARAEPVSLSIQDAVARTLKHNPELFQFELTQEALEARAEVSALSPAMRLELEMENLANTGNEGLSEGSEAVVALSSVIELGGNKRARISVADARIALNRYQQQAFTLDVLGELTAAFIEGLTIQALIELAAEERELLQETVDTIEQRVNQGAAPEAEALRARALLIKAEIRANNLHNQFERLQTGLATFWGARAPGFETFEGNLYAFDKTDGFESLYARAKSSPAMQVFAGRERLHKTEIQLAKANSRSDLNWRAGIQQFADSDESALTASVSMPLFSGKRNAGNVAAARAEREAAILERDSALLQLHSHLYDAWSLRQQSLETFQQINGALIPTLTQALERTQHAWKRGRDRYENLLSAQQELLRAKRMRITSASRVLMNQALIEQLSGETLIHHTPTPKLREK